MNSYPLLRYLLIALPLNMGRFILNLFQYSFKLHTDSFTVQMLNFTFLHSAVIYFCSRNNEPDGLPFIEISLGFNEHSIFTDIVNYPLEVIIL